MDSDSLGLNNPTTSFADNIIWSDKAVDMKYLRENPASFPVLVQARPGFYGLTEEMSISHGQVMFLHGWYAQQRLMLENEEEVISLPVDGSHLIKYDGPLHAPNSKYTLQRSDYLSVKEILNFYQLPFKATVLDGGQFNTKYKYQLQYVVASDVDEGGVIDVRELKALYMRKDISLLRAISVKGFDDKFLSHVLKMYQSDTKALISKDVLPNELAMPIRYPTRDRQQLENLPPGGPGTIVHRPDSIVYRPRAALPVALTDASDAEGHHHIYSYVDLDCSDRAPVSIIGRISMAHGIMPHGFMAHGKLAHGISPGYLDDIPQLPPPPPPLLPPPHPMMIKSRQETHAVPELETARVTQKIDTTVRDVTSEMQQFIQSGMQLRPTKHSGIIKQATHESVTSNTTNHPKDDSDHHQQYEQMRLGTAAGAALGSILEANSNTCEFSRIQPSPPHSSIPSFVLQHTFARVKETQKNALLQCPEQLSAEIDAQRKPSPKQYQRQTSEPAISETKADANIKQRHPSDPGLSETISNPNTVISNIPSDADLSLLSVDDISQCLRLLTLSSHIETFARELIDGELLIEMDENNFRSLGLSGFETRKIKKFIDGWRPKL